MKPDTADTSELDLREILSTIGGKAILLSDMIAKGEFCLCTQGLMRSAVLGILDEIWHAAITVMENLEVEDRKAVIAEMLDSKEM